MDLSERRNDHHMTQQQLADEVKLTRQAISALERGAKPSVATAKKIAKILDFHWTLFFEDGR